MSYFFNITTYTADSTEASLAAEQQVLNSYRKGGFQLIPARYHHLRNFLAMMPFKCGEGLFKELQAAGVVKRAETFRWLTSLPIVADSPLAPAGLPGAHLPKSAGVHRPVLRGNEQYQFQHGSLRDVRGG
uniref:IncF plasmid conjugative transfer pilus assembly protein TraC n=1 Tax=Klebsiella pneumoniae TaxID=573 RepID=A0A8B0SQE8_KLEPN|nr:IncF plasmid conjugative transfer pilus assembly protein TraC [Klebsiella pneumoniae]